MNIEIVFMTTDFKEVARKVYDFPDWVKSISIENNMEIIYSEYEPDWRGEQGFHFCDFSELRYDFHLGKLPFKSVVECSKSKRTIMKDRNNFGITPFFVEV